MSNEFLYSCRLMELLGYVDKTEQVTTNKLWEAYLDTDSVKVVNSQMNQLLNNEVESVDFTVPIVSKQGEKLWLNTIAKVVESDNSGKATLMFGTVKDVTDTKKEITQLQNQNNRLMLAERISLSGHWRFDIKSQQLDWSAEVFRIHGLKNKSISPSLEKAESALIEKDRANFRNKINNAINQLEPFYLKVALVQRSGKRIKVEVIAEIERDHNGEPLAIFGIYKNITRSEDLLEKLKLLSMVNFTIKVPIFFIDDNDNVVYQDISPHHDSASSVLFNYINFSILEYMDYKKQAKFKGQVKENNVSFDKYITVFDLSVTYEADEGIYIWIVENVTEKFRKEQQQVISNRLALLGNTFGNVSHDINNVLGVALGAIEMLEIKFSRGEKDISAYIDRVKNAIDKGKDVTERLLAFTRRPTIKVVSFDPIQDIYDNQYLFKQLLLSTINISFNFETINCLIKFPQGEFINILLNLVLNAQDAIQDKGLSGKIELSANLVNDDRLEIHVKDSGVGIAKENLAKIFDPFYSSKSVSKGNGLGLANVYSTMYKHNGLIQVEGTSDLGGAHFTLVFKCRVLESKHVVHAPKQPTLAYSNTNILVLDDEVSIAEFVGLYVESKGANVVVANTREQLLNIIDGNTKFDIFITDMVLPDLTGKEAVNLVKEKSPDIKVFSISGYIAIEDRSWDYPVLRKPFNAKELGEFLTV